MHVGRNLVTCIPVGNGDGGAIFAKLKDSAPAVGLYEINMLVGAEVRCECPRWVEPGRLSPASRTTAPGVSGRLPQPIHMAKLGGFATVCFRAATVNLGNALRALGERESGTAGYPLGSNLTHENVLCHVQPRQDPSPGVARPRPSVCSTVPDRQLHYDGIPTLGMPDANRRRNSRLRSCYHRGRGHIPRTRLAPNHAVQPHLHQRRQQRALPCGRPRPPLGSVPGN
jgi:hypothetical protein